MNKTPLLFLALGLCTAPVQAQMFKCTDSNGKVTYTETPCKTAGKVVGVVRASASEMQSGKDSLADMRHRGNVAIYSDSVRSIESEISNLKASMDSELAALRTKKLYANNNLAGATYESSVSQEMEAVTKKYQIMIDDATRRLSKARDDLAAVQKTKNETAK